MSAKGWLAIFLGVCLIGLSWWDYRNEYKSSQLYRCDGPRNSQYSFPVLPLLKQISIVDGLEVYIGGWIERGSLTIKSDIFDIEIKEVTFVAGEKVTPVSYARIGEWYNEDFKMSFEPSPGASCAVRIVYKFGGVF